MVRLPSKLEVGLRSSFPRFDAVLSPRRMSLVASDLAAEWGTRSSHVTIRIDPWAQPRPLSPIHTSIRASRRTSRPESSHVVFARAGSLDSDVDKISHLRTTEPSHFRLYHVTECHFLRDDTRVKVLPASQPTPVLQLRQKHRTSASKMAAILQKATAMAKPPPRYLCRYFEDLKCREER